MMADIPATWFGDSDANATFPIWTRANAGEVYPGAATPLAATSAFFVHGEQGYRNSFHRNGAMRPDEWDPDTRNLLGVYGGHLYLNVSIIRVFGVRTPGMDPATVTAQYIGDIPGVPSYEEEARPGDEDATATANITRFITEEIFGRSELPELLEHRRRTLAHVGARGDLTRLSDDGLIARFRSGGALFEELFEQHIVNSGAVGFGIATVVGVCEAIGRPELPMTLVATAGDVDSAAPSHALWSLSRAVRSSDQLGAAFDAGVEGLEARLRSSPEPAAAAFVGDLDAFCREFGSRGPNEWEISSETWGTSPDIALAAVDVMRIQSDDGDPALAAAAMSERRQAALADVRAMLSGADEETRGQFEAGVRAAQVWGAARERSKTTCILFVHEMRLAARELGRRGVAAGALDHPGQIFMLTDVELDDFVESPSSFSGMVREREAQYEMIQQLEPPFVLIGEAPPLIQWPRLDDHRAASVDEGDVLTGIPGCSGIHRGRARVVRDPADPQGLEPGDVLIAPITDPAWTPLFVPAGAVVVDVGAQITHAVIVSRELASPCVVSVTDATHKIPDGALVEVDGGAGTVTVIEMP